MKQLPVITWFWCKKNAIWSARKCRHAKCDPHPERRAAQRPIEQPR